MDIQLRLERLETKIDRMSEALQMLARVEEKIHSANGRIDRLEYRADEQENDVDKLKATVGYNQQNVKLMERFVWVMISSLVGLVAYYIKG